MFGNAKQAEIIRSNQKDEYYSSFIKASVADIIQRIFGPRVWLQWRKEVDLVAGLGYFGLTTFAGFQTLGEEYVNILQVDDTLRSIPRQWVAAPYVIDHLLSYTEKKLGPGSSTSLTPEARKAFLSAIPVIRHTLTLIYRCHLALFYMKGIFYHISKRLTATHYILVRDSGAGALSSYRILGWLSVLQLVFTFVQHLYKWSQSQRKAYLRTEVSQLVDTDVQVNKSVTEAKERPTDPSLKCVLCLENRTSSTATPCGHMFCWSCITEWCSNKPECPLCRESFQMSRLVCLQNYDPS